MFLNRSVMPALRLAAFKPRLVSTFPLQKPLQHPLDLQELRGGVSVVTGSGSVNGIGFGIAKKCRELGMHVCLSDVREEALAVAKTSLDLVEGSGGIAGVVCDVTSKTSIMGLLAECRKQFGDAPIQFLGVNAGIAFPHAPTVLTGAQDEWELAFKVNALGVRDTLKYLVPTMLSQDSKHRLVIELTASAVSLTSGFFGPYSASKMAAMGIFEALYAELACRNHLDRVSMCALCPCRINTDMLLQTTKVARDADPASRLQINLMKAGQKNAGNWRVDQVTDHLFTHLQQGKFYCTLNHMDPATGKESNDTDLAIASRHESIRTKAPPDMIRDLLPFLDLAIDEL